MRAVSLSLFLLNEVSGHGGLITPPSRNAVDRFLPGFAGGRSLTDSCNCGNSKTGCFEGVRASGGGQPCMWFSQGCSIGCGSCTGIGSHSAVSLCNGTAQPTLPTYAWTMNRGVAPGSASDSYRFNPWRSPGTAPVEDACGRAGGTDPAHEGPGEAKFATTIFATMGDLGSRVLAPAPSGTVWAAGASVEVSWGIRFNHGGGYAYRLCPAGEKLTEACFRRTHLEFDRGAQQLQWNNGTRLPINGTFVDEGTRPAGSTWAMNPIPRIDFDSKSSGQPASFEGCAFNGTAGVNGTVVGAACRMFDPPCADGGWYSQPGAVGAVDVEGECSGDWTGGRIVDTVKIPAGLPAGDYVLGESLAHSLTRSLTRCCFCCCCCCCCCCCSSNRRPPARAAVHARRFANTRSPFPRTCLHACCFAHCCPQAGAGTARRAHKCGATVPT